MNWHQLEEGDTVVGEASSHTYTLVRRERSDRGSEWLSLVMLDHEQGGLIVNEIADQPIHFFTVYKANGEVEAT